MTTAALPTLLLDQVTWDLVLDAAHNIAVAQPPYAVAQDAASAIKLFLGELWYDTTQGIPYFTQVLGQAPSIVPIKQFMIAAANTVPGVVNPQVFFASFNHQTRVLTGQVQMKDPASGVLIIVPFSVMAPIG